MIDNSVEIFKCLADKSRLRILSNLMGEAMYVELLSERLDLSASTISFHLKKLESVGLVGSTKEQYYVIYYVNKDMLNSTLLSMITSDEDTTDLWEERQNEYKDKIINTFMKHGKIDAMPVQRKKKRVLLEEILKSFEHDREYQEREVNIIIADFHDDFCTIRREMVDEGMFTRDKGVYKRTEWYK